MYKRVFGLTFAILMLFSMLGCGKAVSEESTTESTTTSATTGTSTTTDVNTTTSAETTNFNAYEFTIAKSQYRDEILWFAEPETEEEQVVMDVWHELETEYSFTTEGIDIPFGEIATYAASGQRAADILYGYVDYFGGAALNDYLLRLDTEEVRSAGLDISDAEHFEQTYMNALKIGGESYFAWICGEYINEPELSATAFNKKLLEGTGYTTEMIYQAVRDREWTWDVFTDICRAAVVPNEAEPVSGEWYYAYSVYGTTMPTRVLMLDAYGCSNVEYADGKYVSTVGSLFGETVYNRYVDFSYRTGLTTFGADGSYSPKRLFYFGKALFYYNTSIFTELPEECDFMYGIVPMPTGSARNEYRCPLWNFTPVFCIQKANGDWEKTCFIMGEFAEKLGEPEAWENKIYGCADDAESMEMLETYILPNLYVSPEDFLGSSDYHTYHSAYLDAIASGGDMVAKKAAEDAMAAVVEEAFARFNK